MPTKEDVELVAARLGVWSDVLGRLSDPSVCAEFLGILDRADGDALHKLIDDWRFPGPVQCLEIVDTITRFVHTGDFDFVETCSFVNILRPPSPSTTSGRGYRLRDGSVLWLTEAQWWEMSDHAVNDPAWREKNKELLQDLGIMICTIELVPTITRFDIEKRYTICTPTWDPRE
jgi:hypothetical protein